MLGGGGVQAPHMLDWTYRDIFYKPPKLKGWDRVGNRRYETINRNKS